MKNDKTIIAYHFGQYYGLPQKEWRLPKIEIDWLIKVLRNGCFHNGPVRCPRLSHIGPRKVVLVLGVASGQCNLPWAIIINLGHITGSLWKHPFINTIIITVMFLIPVDFNFFFFFLIWFHHISGIVCYIGTLPLYSSFL